MPSNLNPLGALPSRFRRPRVLIVGCGDVGLRVAALLPSRVKVIALTSSVARVPELRACHIAPLHGNLDDGPTLRRLAGLATRVVHLAPPPTEQPSGDTDPRTRALIQALRLRGLPLSLVYGSTSGVYGDCHGDWVNETRPGNPQTARAWRRMDAEASVRLFGRAAGVKVHILRIPGIYAPDRDGGTPRGRLIRGSPVLRPEDDVYTNHIHADDLARACLAGLWRGKPQRITNTSDDSELKMGDYFDFAADLYQLPRPERLAREALQARLPATMWSFMGESRRLDNQRLKRELRLVLRFPTIREGLSEPTK